VALDLCLALRQSVDVGDIGVAVTWAHTRQKDVSRVERPNSLFRHRIMVPMLVGKEPVIDDREKKATTTFQSKALNAIQQMIGPGCIGTNELRCRCHEQPEPCVLVDIAVVH
jgi:hypothetical protein